MIKSFAKVNLILDLGAKTVGGRYETNFVMQEISIHDLISVELIKNGEIVIECDDPNVPTDERNLCYKAVRLMQEISGFKDGAKIVLNKKIPSAGGLGGGSSDAAKVALILRDKWKLQLNDDELISKINPALGTDASFFVKGGTAVVSINGNRVSPVKNSAGINLVFVLPNVDVPANKTAEMYSCFDPEKVKTKSDIKGMIAALEAGSLEGIAAKLYNAFEFSLPSHYDSVLKLKRELMEFGCLGSLMCGAGPTVFGICKDMTSAEKIAGVLREKYKTVFVANSV